ncbi:BEL1-like homeodomain protein 3 [Ipomoea triloba]|uniref:BEL1-like homeodomain protein 3 n=1 Tax=Ipomoea triloba TaxID=35885 RepID=UPI00125D5670|nr:BEL1-like homeodomain protein 3 [Ipomoea triloba]
MATYFSSLSDQRDDLPMPLLPNEKHSSYQSSGLPDNLMYLNHPPYPELSSGSSLPAHNYGEAQSIRTRDEMLFIPPTSDPASMQPIGRVPNIGSSFSDVNSTTVEPHTYSSKPFDAQSVEQSLQYQGLSLSLAMQVPGSVQVPGYHDQYTNSGFSPLMSAHVMHSDQGSHDNNENKSGEYLSFDLAGAQNNVKIGGLGNLDRSMSLREMNFNPQIHDVPAVAGSIYNSKYLKATQELLDEVVNVHTALKQSDKPHNLHSFGQDEEADMKSSCSGTGMSSDGHKSTNTSSGELSAAERHDLESKMTKLFSMLDEVDRRYKQYYQQMQAVVSSFEMVTGLGAARPYTALALRTISCQFRCLRDAIKKQIHVTRQSLGEQGNSQGERLYRLRYVDQQLRQQRSLQQFGMMRQPWRPQRGLPENAVSVLRAWLFEHFLHPYPKDSEKIMLARQTGLTRSQVANWFINARVRLWKPMIEDMYKEEFGDPEGGLAASPEHLTGAAAKEKSVSDDQGEEELHESLTSIAQSNDLRANVVPNEDRNMSSARLGFQDASHENEQHTTLSNQTGNEGIIAGTSAYGVSVFRGIMGNQVSLALGLQHNQNDPQPPSGTQLIGDDDKPASSMDIGKADYYYIDPANQQERFASSHLLPDFVV